jgi:hypothetical protein
MSNLGASSFPNTNNALERNNKKIKDSHFLRERVPFKQFTMWTEKMVEVDWSIGRSNPREVVQVIKPHLYVSAYSLKESKRRVFVLETNKYWAVLSEEFPNLSPSEAKNAARLLYSNRFLFSTITWMHVSRLVLLFN